MNCVTKFKKGDEILEIFIDDLDFSPRENDNLGIMVCAKHSHYSLGDVQVDNFEDYLESMDLTPKDIPVMLELWLYDHSGLSMSCSNFDGYDPQRFDSGQIGVIYAEKSRIKEYLQVKRITKKTLKRVENILKAEIWEYDQYLRGNVYYYVHSKVVTCDQGHEHKEAIDSCGGFIGDIDENGIWDDFKKDEWIEVKA